MNIILNFYLFAIQMANSSADHFSRERKNFKSAPTFILGPTEMASWLGQVCTGEHMNLLSIGWQPHTTTILLFCPFCCISKCLSWFTVSASSSTLALRLRLVDISLLRWHSRIKKPPQNHQNLFWWKLVRSTNAVHLNVLQKECP